MGIDNQRPAPATQTTPATTVATMAANNAAGPDKVAVIASEVIVAKSPPAGTKAP